MEGTLRPMRTNHLKNPLKNKIQPRFPASQLTILIKIESSTIQLLLLKTRCPLPTGLPIIHPRRENITLQSPNPRRTTGRISPILKREDAFKIELHRESSVSLALSYNFKLLMTWKGDKAKEAKERQDREAENRAHAGHSYHTPDPGEMGTEDDLSGLPWGSLSLRHVVSKGKAKEEESRSRSKTHEDRSSHYEQEPVYEERDAYYEGDSTYYEEDRAYYDYGSGGSASHGGRSR